MSQTNQPSSTHPSGQQTNGNSTKRVYHKPAPPQEFGQLRTLTLGGITYVPEDINSFSASGG